MLLQKTLLTAACNNNNSVVRNKELFYICIHRKAELQTLGWRVYSKNAISNA